MAHLYLIRHGKSAAGFDEALDADLSDAGHGQAAGLAADLARRLPPIALFSSPFRRARSTAAPLAAVWRRPVEIAEPITEIPVPAHLGEGNLAARRPWLTDIMTRSYGQLDNPIENWRQTLFQFLTSFSEDAVLFTHYLTINAAVGFALKCNKVTVCDPGYCTSTELKVADRDVSIVSISS